MYEGSDLVATGKLLIIDDLVINIVFVFEFLVISAITVGKEVRGLSGLVLVSNGKTGLFTELDVTVL